MIVTTAFDETEELVQRAEQLASSLAIPYVARRKKTVKSLLDSLDSQLFVVNNQRGLSYYEKGQDEVFFHPNMAMHRIKQLERGQSDSLVTACKLEAGMSFLDCTLGLASDTLVANYQVGSSGKVVSLEKSFPLFVLVREGLHADNLDYLRTCEDNAFDVVYFDFMFHHTVESSQGIKIIKPIVSYDVMTPEHVKEAMRVAKQRVVVKSSYKNPMIEPLGFTILRQNQKRHFFYGVIEMEGAFRKGDGV